MSFTCKCPGCANVYELEDSLRGQRVACQECRQVFYAGIAEQPAEVTAGTLTADDPLFANRVRPVGSTGPIYAPVPAGVEQDLNGWMLLGVGLAIVGAAILVWPWLDGGHAAPGLPVTALALGIGGAMVLWIAFRERPLRATYVAVLVLAVIYATFLVNRGTVDKVPAPPPSPPPASSAF